MDSFREEFICESMTVIAGTFDTSGMSRGEPGLPKEFTWREQKYQLAKVIKTWKSSGPCRNSGREMYIRRHWFKILVEPPLLMTVYFDRQAKGRKKPKARWWVYSIEPVESNEESKES